MTLPLQKSLGLHQPGADVWSSLHRMLAEQEGIESTVACGAVPGSPAARRVGDRRLPVLKPAVCTDSQERACRWIQAPDEKIPADLRQRTELRPRECPRRQALEREQWEHSPERPRRARGKRIPEEMIALLDQSPNRTPAIEQTRRWFRDSKRYLVLCGPALSGKTFAACRWLEAQTKGLFVRAEELLPGLHAKASDAEAKLLRTVLDATVLVLDGLDDIPAAQVAGFADKLEDLVISIARKGGRLVITTRMDVATFLAFVTQTGTRTNGAKRIELYGTVADLYHSAA